MGHFEILSLNQCGGECSLSGACNKMEDPINEIEILSSLIFLQKYLVARGLKTLNIMGNGLIGGQLFS